MPLTLRLLGGTDLTGADGQSVAALLAQPKRFALLVYLLQCQPVRLHRRDALVAMFWPELDEERARGALSQALSFLRRGLGEGVVLSRGGEEVGIDLERIACDTRLFEAAADAGEHDRAVALYAGHLLESFHVDDCPEFADWLDGERRRLRDRAARSARLLAVAADRGGDRSVGVVDARRALVLAPYDEAVAGRLMIALELAGRRGQALEEYRHFVARLAADLEMEPSPELRATADAIRTGAHGAGSSNAPAATSVHLSDPVAGGGGPVALTTNAASRSGEAELLAVDRATSRTGLDERSVAPPALGRRDYYEYAIVLIALAAAAQVATSRFALPAWIVPTTVLIGALVLPLLMLVRRPSRSRGSEP